MFKYTINVLIHYEEKNRHYLVIELGDICIDKTCCKNSSITRCIFTMEPRLYKSFRPQYDSIVYL